MQRFLTAIFLCMAAFASHAMTPAEELAAKSAALSSPGTGPSHPLAASAGYSATLEDADPDWNRPFADGTCCSGLGPVDYETQIFHVTASGLCSVASVQSGWDGYLFVYRAPFDSTAQTVNFVAGDDDGNGGIGTSDIENIALTANTDYVVVTTGFANGDRGAFTNTISCAAGDVILASAASTATSVPTMGTWGLALLAALMLAAIAWQQRKLR